MAVELEEKGRFARLIDAIKEVWFYSITGIIIGGGFVFWGTAIEHDPIPKWAPTLLEHVGMGFIVAAVAVLFYEWGAHIKDSLKLSAELKAIKDAVAENALANVLRANIRGESTEFDNEIVENLQSIIMQLKKLHDGGDWARHGHAHFIGHLLQHAAENAERLCQVSTQLQSNRRSAPEHHIRAPSPAEITDTLLAEQMSRLPNGGRYNITANPRSWRGRQLHKLHAESRQAVLERGVLIRRIFVLAHEGAHRSETLLSETREVIQRHFDDACTWNGNGKSGYEMRIMNTADRDRLRDLPLDAADFIFRNHFAIFERPEGEHHLYITAAEPDLSELTISGLPSDSRQIQRFNAVWDKLPKTTAKRLEEILSAWETEV